MEETGKMDLTLNVDFDSSLLNWQEEVAEMSAAAAGGRRVARAASTETTARPGFMRMPSFPGDGQQSKATAAPATMASVGNTKQKDLQGGGTAAAAPVIMPPTASSMPAPAPWTNPQFALPAHFYHHLASTTQPAAAPVPGQLQQASSGSSPAVLPQHHVAHPHAPVVAQANTGVSQNHAAAAAAYMGAMAAHATKTTAAATPSTAQQSHFAQYQALQPKQATATTSSFAPQQQHHQATNHPQLHPLAMPASAPYQANGVPMMFNPLLHVTQTVAASNSFMSMLQQQMGNMAGPPAAPAPQAPTKTPAPTKSKTNKKSTSDAPPFLLFDAPCELRTNFIQSQRMHGIPITQDNNSYHYGMAVNGFHPQVNAQDNPILPLASTSLPMHNIQLVDGRHHRNKRGVARERNEREQKRAQKITELIEQLRISIEKGGWRVELKSKYHTLTTCADYVKHLIKTTQEKEAAVEQAKLDLTVKECKLAEDKAALEARSDPESVVSSLTDGSAAKVSASSGSSDEDNKKEDDDEESPRKKRRLDGDSPDSSILEEGPGGQNISLDKMSSSVSEMTDSNKGSSPAKNGRVQVDGEVSISSTVPVVRGEGIVDPPHGHADVVVKKGKRKRRRQELTSLEPNFQLDYKEVFVSSNVPQFIATPTGKIVVCNDFFLKATGLSKKEAEGMTIFSIVEADKLSNLFEMIGEALKRDNTDREAAASLNETRQDCSSTTNSTSTDKESKASTTASNTSRVGDYAALTLPCVSFPAHRHPNPLYMTVTLMTDEDPRKRCFHCVITDCPGTNGTLGSITHELLTLLFAEPTSC